ncbi:glucokinase [Niveibacterium sp. SC-1]|uniref:glucokinase n=1 Tax=Niveibacterium sp. SC-1 TaxID=3135646 RepID=UPI00311E7C0C
MSSGVDKTFPRLLGDIGGTNARFALIRYEGGPVEEIRTLSGADYPGPAEAIEAYLKLAGGERPVAGAIGIANPIDGDSIKMTNHTWAFSIEALRKAVGLTKLIFINDFTALALSLPHLPANELVQVGGKTADKSAAIGVLGPGTGLGVSGLIPSPSGYIPLSGEGGHVTISARTEEEFAVVQELGRTYPHVSAERILSGPGLVNLHEALAAVRGLPSPGQTAPEIGAAALEGKDKLAVDSIHMFCAFLGTVAGNLALTLGARGGVFIGGGIIPRLGDLIHRTPFRARFEEKGRFQGYLGEMPVWVIHSAYPALIGSSVALTQAFA